MYREEDLTNFLGQKFINTVREEWKRREVLSPKVREDDNEKVYYFFSDDDGRIKIKPLSYRNKSLIPCDPNLLGKSTRATKGLLK